MTALLGLLLILLGLDALVRAILDAVEGWG